MHVTKDVLLKHSGLTSVLTFAGADLSSESQASDHHIVVESKTAVEVTYASILSGILSKELLSKPGALGGFIEGLYSCEANDLLVDHVSLRLTAAESPELSGGVQAKSGTSVCGRVGPSSLSRSATASVVRQSPRASGKRSVASGKGTRGESHALPKLRYI